MRRVLERRASAVLYNLLRSIDDDRPWLLPANVCPIVPIAFRKAGRAFALADVAEPDYALPAAVTGDYAGVVFVRTYGAVFDAAERFAAWRAAGMVVIDDRCLCRPELDEPAGAGADVVLYSTGYAKHVDLGWGGFAFVADGVPYERHEPAFDPVALDEVTARYKAALAARAPFQGGGEPWLDARAPEHDWAAYRALVARQLAAADAHKAALTAIYRAGIPGDLQLPEPFHAWRFQLRTPEAARVVEALFADGLFASRHYQALAGVFDGGGRYPVAEALQASIVNLFCDRYYDEARARRTVDVVRRVTGR